MLMRARRALRRQAHEAYGLTVRHGLKVPGMVPSARGGWLLACDHYDKPTGRVTVASVYMNDDGRITQVKEHLAMTKLGETG